MQIKIVGLVLAMGMGLAACGDTLGERALSGAGIGALSATVLGGNAATGAIVGGAAGVICDQTNTCPN